MMAASTLKSRCVKCEEIQRLYLVALEDKRAILVRLQAEQERTKRFSKEIESLKREIRQAEERLRTEENTNPSTESNELSRTVLKGTELEKRLNEAMAVNRKWKEEYQQLKEKYESDLRKLQEEVNSLNHKLEESNTHILALEAENMRLAQALYGDNINTGSSGNDPENELVKIQMQAYKDDFSCERRDRERVQSEKESLKEELKSAQEIVATLLEEIEIYKVQHSRDQEKMKQILSQQSLTQPQLQIVYPVVDPSERQQQTQWRRQQQRMGILSRGAHVAPPSAFYGGDVEVDQEDGPKSEPVSDRYRTL